MVGTNAFYAPKQNQALMLGAPKLIAQSRESSALAYVAYDGADFKVRNSPEAVFTGLCDEAFDPKHGVELRLFRYSRSSSRGGNKQRPARWSPLPHIEGGVNDYDPSIWLGGGNALTDRFSRIKLDGFAEGDKVDVVELVRHWLAVKNFGYYDSPGNIVYDKMLLGTWASNPGIVSVSRGISRNVQYSRFAVAYVAKHYDDKTGKKWYLASPLSTFMMGYDHHPLWFNHFDSVQSAGPGDAGQRFYKIMPNWDYTFMSARITGSEFLTG